MAPVSERALRLVVTGGSGLLGSWVVRELGRTDGGRIKHHVRVFDRQPPPPGLTAEFVKGEIEDLDQVLEACRDSDAIVHLAGVPRNGLATPSVTYQVNTIGSFNAHEAAALLGIDRVVSMGSEAALGWVYRLHDFAPEYLPVDEAHPLSPQDTYALSKQVLEVIARSYTLRAGLTTVVLRPPWIATPEDIDTLAREGGREVTDFRLYNYVDVRDVASAVRCAVEQPIDGHHALFVTADDSSVGEPLNEVMARTMPSIADMATELTGTTPSVTNQRAKEILGWAPEHSWRAGSRPGEGA
jgi:nucleoside-diphosphate-sugar epimerase